MHEPKNFIWLKLQRLGSIFGLALHIQMFHVEQNSLEWVAFSRFDLRVPGEQAALNSWTMFHVEHDGGAGGLFFWLRRTSDEQNALLREWDRNWIVPAEAWKCGLCCIGLR